MVVRFLFYQSDGKIFLHLSITYKVMNIGVFPCIIRRQQREKIMFLFNLKHIQQTELLAVLSS